MSKERKTAFHRPRSGNYLMRISPPEAHIVPWFTGGLRQIYHDIRHQGHPPLHRFGDYTDKNGCFCPRQDMGLLAFRYKYVEIIGQGQSSVFIKAKDTFRDDFLVSIKVLHSHNNALGAQEAECLWKLNQADPDGFSPTLRLYTTFTFDDHYCMVFELLNPRQLNKYFEDLPPGDARLPFVRQVALHLLQSLGFLQQQNVIHADLKPENILLKDDERFETLKVVDFGNAIHCVHEELSLYYGDFELQTLLYRAPEVMFGTEFGLEVDLWSLGCILAELFSGIPLFYGKDKASILTKTVELLGPVPQRLCKRGKFFKELRQFTATDPQTDATSSIMKALKCKDWSFANFLAGLLSYDPATRLTVQEAAQHRFLAPLIGLKYLLPVAHNSQVSAAYPTVTLTPDLYPHSPFVDEEIRVKQLSSIELLRTGTEFCPTPLVCPKPEYSHLFHNGHASPTKLQVTARSSVKSSASDTSRDSTSAVSDQGNASFGGSRSVQGGTTEERESYNSRGMAEADKQAKLRLMLRQMKEQERAGDHRVAHYTSLPSSAKSIELNASVSCLDHRRSHGPSHKEIQGHKIRRKLAGRSSSQGSESDLRLSSPEPNADQRRMDQTYMVETGEGRVKQEPRELWNTTSSPVGVKTEDRLGHPVLVTNYGSVQTKMPLNVYKFSESPSMAMKQEASMHSQDDGTPAKRPHLDHNLNVSSQKSKCAMSAEDNVSKSRKKRKSSGSKRDTKKAPASKRKAEVPQRRPGKVLPPTDEEVSSDMGAPPAVRGPAPIQNGFHAYMDATGTATLPKTKAVELRWSEDESSDEVVLLEPRSARRNKLPRQYEDDIPKF